MIPLWRARRPLKGEAMATAKQAQLVRATPGIWRLLLVAAAYLLISAALAHG